ncbi:MAG: methyltransferase domain-containing protein [Halioglobus sp.]
MTEIELLIALHRGQYRQGPGDDAITQRAIELARLEPSCTLKVADVGCGTGAASRLLASQLDAKVTSVDFLPEFLQELEIAAEAEGIANRITTLNCSMDTLPFENNSLDVIWSEGAIYNIGFESGLRQWRNFLKPGGILAVTEITWLTDQRSEEIDRYWNNQYPQIDTAANKLSQLEANGYSPLAYFVLPEFCWLDNYYKPLERQFPQFLKEQANSKEARAVVKEYEAEQAMYEQYASSYSYGFYIAKKVPA